MKIRVINDVTGRETTIETARPGHEVTFDLMQIVRSVNRRKDDTLRACLHMRSDGITLTWFTPWIHAENLAERLLELGEPIYAAESVITGSQRSAIVATSNRDDVAGGGL